MFYMVIDSCGYAHVQTYVNINAIKAQITTVASRMFHKSLQYEPRMEDDTQVYHL